MARSRVHSLVRVVVEDTGIHCIDSTLHLTMLALKGAVLLENSIAPGHILQGDDGTHLIRLGGRPSNYSRSRTQR